MSKTCLITGASSGLGSAIAQMFAQERYHIILVGRNKNNLEKTGKEVEKRGGTQQIIPADLSTLAGINNLISQLKKSLNSLDVIVNAAAIWHGENEVFAGKDFDTFTQSVVTDTMMVGTMAPTLITHAFIPLMLPKSKIINISGTFENGGKGWLPYYVSKRGIEDLTVALADELKDKDIQVNCISPSDTATPAYMKYFPEYINDSIDPEEIAKFIAKLCSAESNNVTGKVFVMKKDQPVVEQFHA